MHDRSMIFACAIMLPKVLHVPVRNTVSGKNNLYFNVVFGLVSTLCLWLYDRHLIEITDGNGRCYEKQAEEFVTG
jgi:hypothetical protein